jgi:hypothetical protein
MPRLPKIPPEVATLLEPFGRALTDMAKKAIESALDSALEDAEARIEDVAQRVAGVRRKIRKPRKRADDIVVETAPVRRKRSRD